MGRISILLSLTLLLSFRPASGQTVDFRVAAGPTLIDRGHSFAAGVGFSPFSKLTFAANFERTHLETRIKRTPDSVSAFRGGTLSLGTVELQVTPWDRSRVRPFGVVGFAAGQSRPNVNEMFPNRVVNDVRAFFAGGGVKVPLSERVTIFGDARMMVGAEGIEGIVAVAPLRAGVTWGF